MMNRKTVRIAELQDEDPSDYDYPDDYAPDPRASQRVAAQKRKRPTHDTEEIAPLVSPARRYAPAALVLIVLLMIGAASYQLAQLPSAKPLQITPAQTFAPAALQATSAPTSAPTATIRTIGAYASPDGVLLGQIELNRMRIPVAHCGADWAQSDVDGSGLVWIRRVDVPDLPITGPDLCVPAQQPQGRGLTVNNEWTPPEATLVPPAEPTSAPWPVSAPVAPDMTAPNIKEHLNAPRAPGQDG